MNNMYQTLSIEDLVSQYTCAYKSSIDPSEKDLRELREELGKRTLGEIGVGKILAIIGKYV